MGEEGLPLRRSKVQLHPSVQVLVYAKGERGEDLILDEPVVGQNMKKGFLHAYFLAKENPQGCFIKDALRHLHQLEIAKEVGYRPDLAVEEAVVDVER